MGGVCRVAAVADDARPRAQSTSTTIDFYSTFTDIYQLTYEAGSIDNPDLANGGVRNE